MIHRFFFFLTFSLFILPAESFAGSPVRFIADSLSVRRDSLPQKDTVEINQPLKFFGSMEMVNDTMHVSPLTSQQLPWLDYRSLGDLLSTLPNFFYNDVGSVGQQSQLMYGGYGPVRIFIDGRPMNEPLTGFADLNMIPAEMIERVEIIPASGSFLYGMNSTVAINIITKSYDSKQPYSRIRYTEGAYEEGLFDGVLAHNIARNVNMTVGVQRRSTDGRFDNSADDEWSVRTKLRWNVSEKFNVEVLELYNKQKVGLFGGVDWMSSQDMYDPTFAVVNYPHAMQTNTRWDWQITGAGKFFDDSLNTTSFSLYTSNALHEYRDTSFTPVVENTWGGFSVLQKIHLDKIVFDIGGNVEAKESRGDILQSSTYLFSQHFQKTYSSIFGKGEFEMFPYSTFSAYGKFENYFGYSYFSLGSDVSIRGESGQGLFIGVVNRSLFSQDVQVGHAPFTKPSIEVRYNTPTNNKYVLELCYFDNDLSRKSNSGDLFNLTKFGSINQSYHTNKFFIELNYEFGVPVPPFGNMNLIGNQSEYFNINSTIYYLNSLFEGHLEIKTGLRGKYFYSVFGDSYWDPNDIERFTSQSTFYPSLDFLFFAKLGDAVIHFTVENLLGTNYYTVPFYPMPDRNLRLGVTWEFLN